MLATISNRRNINLDVYYQKGGQPATIIGEISAGSTQTFTLPNEGRGGVFLRGVRERPGSPQPDIDIRMHCAA
jgi:hypothetical protein